MKSFKPKAISFRMQKLVFESLKINELNCADEKKNGS